MPLESLNELYGVGLVSNLILYGKSIIASLVNYIGYKFSLVPSIDISFTWYKVYFSSN